jgi:secreted trypsin-like serine protease
MKVLIVLLSALAVSQAVPHFLKAWPTRIVGGEPATPAQFPHQVTFRYNNRHICGGSIASANKIVTAAHCCEVGSAASFKIVAGDHSLSQNDGTEQEIQVSNVAIHPDYSSFDLSSDICVLTLASNINLSGSAARTIELAADNDDPTGDATCTGWGTTSEGGSVADILRWVVVPIITNAKCQEAYGSDVIPSMICAGLDQGGKDSCQGDSGGPLTAQVGGQTKLVGIVSWGYGCARPGYPGVYTRVSSFADWLRVQLA